MPDNKAPGIVVKESQLNAPVAEAPLPEPRTGAGAAEKTCVQPAPVVPDTAPLTRPTLRKRTGNSRERMAHLARTFPALWPDFGKGKFRPMKVGIKEQAKAWIEAHPDCGMTFGEWGLAVRVVVSRIDYQRCVREGETRYDIYGEPAGIVTAKESAYARLQVSRIKARLNAYRDREKKQHDA